MGQTNSGEQKHEYRRFSETGPVKVGDWTVNLSTDTRYLGGRVVWPSALGLARAIVRGIVDVKDKRVLELGAGLGLPAFAAERCGARTVHVSDRADLQPVYDQNRKVLNSSKTEWLSLDWTEIERFDEIPQCDVVLGADIVYFEEQDALVAVLDRLLGGSGGASTVFILAYRERTDLDRAFLNEVLLGRYRCERKLVLEEPAVELYWLRGVGIHRPSVSL